MPHQLLCNLDRYIVFEKHGGIGVEDRMKADAGVSSVKDLNQRFLLPGEQAAYDAQVKQLEQSDVWRKATAEQRAKVESMVYEMAAGSKTGAAIEDKINGGEQYGLDSTEYLLYRLALEVVYEPTASGKYGSYTKTEAEKAAGMVPGLSDAAIEYLKKVK